MVTSILISLIICSGGGKEFDPSKCQIGVIECTVKDVKNINDEIVKCIKEK